MIDRRPRADGPRHASPEGIAHRRSPGSHVVHDAIVAEGMEELSRATPALAWSALAGGLSIGFSLIVEAILHASLPHAAWTPLVTKLGYSVGFLIVILGRQQLFTENTLTPILPLLDRDNPVTLLNVARLWSVVLAGNLLGTLVLAVVVARTDLLGADVRGSVLVIGREALQPGFGLTLLRAIFAGWLIALLVWLMPAAETTRVWVIIIITWVIGVGQFSHVIAGASEVFVLASVGEVSWWTAFGGFVLPALIGNVIGGVALVAFLNHAQVRSGEDG